MAKVLPFKGIRYNLEKVKNISDVITPPYDVIDDKAQKNYYKKNPYNSIRLELGYQFPDDSENENRYTRAACHFRKWLEEGVLIREARDALYLYEQQFSINTTDYTRTGFFARVKLEDFTTGRILPHEETLLKPKVDRLALMSECVANFSPIFVFYVDEEMTLDQEYEKVKEAQAEIGLTDAIGEQHRVWVMTDPKLNEKITSTLENQVLYIADGHHRYETALEFYRQNRDQYPACSSILIYLVNACDPGMVVLPTHRVVHSLPDLDLIGFRNKLEEYFYVEKIDSQEKDLSSLLKKQQDAGKTAFIMGTREPALYLVVLRDNSHVQDSSPGKSLAWCSLDASVLQTLIFQKILDMSPEKIADQEHITYTREDAAALNALNHNAQLVFLLNPTKISEIIKVASAGDKMPQKSTYFYPKLLTGLVFNDLKC
ncbi:MAG: DUF1015 domain-containing protein [Syntrophaceticus sp.]|nr:DUF1015 domain-containing protein [Syntrophaceticus sp.]MDD4360359.1 DUF1015 domain-containing protein [Syntrophaceticus sp.]MDD4783600.1 DUF1015 domain-containing protein [Syntrophaceticus sp.]